MRVHMHHNQIKLLHVRYLLQFLESVALVFEKRCHSVEEHATWQDAHEHATVEQTCVSVFDLVKFFELYDQEEVNFYDERN